MEISKLKKIANELGVSISTVSRAINGKTVVKEETRRRVMTLAKKYAYSPNAVARALQKSSTQTIAVVLPDIFETFFGNIVKAIEQVVSRKGYMLILADTHEKADEEEKLLKMLYDRRVDALVLATVAINGNSVRLFLDRGTPIVFIDNVPALKDIDVITIDNRKAGYIAVEYLLNKGHQKIAVIIGSKEETTGVERLIGCQEAMTVNGAVLDEHLIAYGDYKRESGYTAMRHLLEQKEAIPFTAVYVTSEKMTYGAMQAILESGLNVPEDISVIGFDIHAADDSRNNRITSVCQPAERIGCLVGERLLCHLNTDDYIKTNFVFLEPFLKEGDAVRKI